MTNAAPTSPQSPSVAADSAKLLMAASVIALGLVIPVENWPMHGVLAAFVFLAQGAAGIPLSYLLRRLALFLPVLLLFAGSILLGRGSPRSGEIAASILLRGTLAFLTMLWLVHVLPLPRLLVTLRRWHCPATLIAILSFMHRFSFLLWHEVERMKSARRCRSFGAGGLWFRWTVHAQVIGMLLIRSLRRAERVHSAMLARGWDGRVRLLEEPERAP